MKQVYRMLDTVLSTQNVNTVFQPIVSLRDGSVLGYEALSRIPAFNVEELFALAEQCNRTWELDKLCWSKAIQNYCAKADGYKGKLFVNVDANSIYDPSFQNNFTRHNVPDNCIGKNTVILEISEKNAIRDAVGFHSYLAHCEKNSFLIAIDDAGAGYSGLTLIADVNPHFIKLDKKLVRDINNSRIKYAIIKGMVELSEAANILLIAEGVETPQELDTLVSLGVHYGQGFIFARPNPSLVIPDPKALQLLQELNRKKNHTFGKSITEMFADNICRKDCTLSPSDRCMDAQHIFNQSSTALTSLCVVHNGQPVGIIERNALQFKIDCDPLFANEPVENCMKSNFLSVDYQMSVSAVAKLAMERPADRLYNPIVLLKDKQYLGMISIKDLLLKTIEIESVSSKYQNPLTGLPGNLLIQQRIACCLESEQTYTFLLLDLDHFKAYNNTFGFEYGDRMIKILANCIVQALPCNQFVGHFSSDNFILICDLADTNALRQRIQSKFAMEIQALYAQKERPPSFPFLSLTIVECSNKQKNLTSVSDILGELLRLKQEAKKSKAALV